MSKNFIHEKKHDFFYISVVLFLFMLSNPVESLAWSGKVVDNITGKSIEGAVIVRSWDRVTVSPAGSDTQLEDVKEIISDKNGKFKIYRKLFFGSIPVLSPVIENKPIIYKPGYKFLILEDKISIINLERVPTILNLRKKEIEKAKENYEVDFYETNIFKGMIEREEEFIQFKGFVKRRRLSENKRQLVRQRIKRKRLKRKIISEKQRKISDSRGAEHLINALQDENINIRKRAANSLGEIEIIDPGQMNDLKIIAETQIEGWNDKSKDVKIIPIASLGRIGTPVVETLIEALKHENKDVRWKAATALVETQSPESIEPLIAALGDEDPYVRRKVAWSLKGSNDPEIIKHLIVTLNDDLLRVRRNAASSLGDIADPIAIKPLINALKCESEHPYAYTQALMRMGDAATQDLISALKDDDWRVRREVASILTYTEGDSVVETLINASNDKNSKVLIRIAFALGEFRDYRAVDPLITLLKNEDPEVRWRAAEALGKLQDQRAIEPLINALQDPSIQVRKSVVEALGMMKDKRVAEALIGAWMDMDSNVRKIAAEVLVDIGSQAVESLIKLLKHKNSYFRWRAAWALGKIGDPKTAEYLTPLLQDEVSEVRFIAAESLRYSKM